jgi:uncharacterized membrane protein
MLKYYTSKEGGENYSSYISKISTTERLLLIFILIAQKLFVCYIHEVFNEICIETTIQ